MEGIQSSNGMWLDASSRWAREQENYDRQVRGQMVGSVESVSQYVEAPIGEPTHSMLDQLMGLTQQLATSLIRSLPGYQQVVGQSPQKALGSVEDRESLLPRVEKQPQLREALELTIRHDKMCREVQGQMGSLVAA